MLFHDVSPSRDESVAEISAALQAEKGRVYLDTNVLIHCYEMSALASNDLLSALGRYGSRVGVPIWAANETWEHLKERESLVNRYRPLRVELRSSLARIIHDSRRCF